MGEKERIMKRLLLILAALLPLCASAADLSLCNSRVELVFSSEGQYALKSFKVDGEQLLLPGGSTMEPWSLTYLGPNGENPLILPRWTFYDGAELSADGHSIELRWRVVIEKEAVWPVTVKVSLGEESELPQWSICADMPRGWVIDKVEFPKIMVARPEGVKGIMSVGFGAEYPIPAGDKIQSRYPSCTGGMQLILAHSPKGTFYFAADDKGGCGKLLQIRGEGQTGLSFVQEVVTSRGWTVDGHFELPWQTTLAFNPDSWENTVLKWYRPFTFETKWGEKTISERKIVDWVKEADLWMRPADATPQMMDAVTRACKYYGKGLGMHWYYWHGHPFDSYYPEYFPTQPGFREMVAKTRSMGAHVTPYINGRLWDPATESYERLHGCDASCRKPDGSLYTEIYSSKIINTVTCPASEIWQNVLKDVNRRILDSLGTDGVYMDQIGAAASEPCYSTAHGHAPGNGDWWPAAYRKLLTDMRKEFYTDDQAMTTEENAECYIDLFDMMLVVNGPHTPTVHMVPLFPLVYSDRCIYSGFTYIPWRINDGSFNFISMKSLLWGSQLGWINPELLLREENAKEAAFLKELADFRKHQHDLFLGGRFLGEFIPEGDNPQVNVPNYQTTHVVLGALWQSVRGKNVRLLVNMDAKPHKVVLPDGKSVTVPAYGAKRCE